MRSVPDGSDLAFSTFAFTVWPGFIWFNGFLLKARDGRGGIVRSVPACLQRARQHKSSGRRGFGFSNSAAPIDGEQNGKTAASASNAQIPLLVRLGPWRNVHRTTLDSLNQNTHATGNLQEDSSWKYSTLQGRQSRNESQKIVPITIAFRHTNSKHVILETQIYRAQQRRTWGKNFTLEIFLFLRQMKAWHRCFSRRVRSNLRGSLRIAIPDAAKALGSLKCHRTRKQPTRLPDSMAQISKVGRSRWTKRARWRQEKAEAAVAKVSGEAVIEANVGAAADANDGRLTSSGAKTKEIDGAYSDSRGRIHWKRIATF